MDTVVVATLGLKIKRARERKCWTQQQLADAIQVSRDAIVKWETDQRAPRNRIGALEDVLGIDQGPMVLMIENHRTGATWRRMMSHPVVQRGLRRAGFAAR